MILRLAVLVCVCIALAASQQAALSQTEFRQLQNSGSHGGRLSITVKNDQATSSSQYYQVTTNGLPQYQTSRDHSSATTREYTWNIPKTLAYADKPGCLPMGTIGFTIHGVPLFNAYNIQKEDAVKTERFDQCNGHYSPHGTYHYHQLPVGGGDCGVHNDAVDDLIGVAIDGFPIYGPKVRENGVEKTLTTRDLDACHGREVNGVYKYHITKEFPYILGCYKGKTLPGSRIAECTTEEVSVGKICSCAMGRPGEGGRRPPSEGERPGRPEGSARPPVTGVSRPPRQDRDGERPGSDRPRRPGRHGGRRGRPGRPRGRGRRDADESNEMQRWRRGGWNVMNERGRHQMRNGDGSEGDSSEPPRHPHHHRRHGGHSGRRHGHGRPRPTGHPNVTGRPHHHGNDSHSGEHRGRGHGRPRPTGRPNITGHPHPHPRPTGHSGFTGSPLPTPTGSSTDDLEMLSRQLRRAYGSEEDDDDGDDDSEASNGSDDYSNDDSDDDDDDDDSEDGDGSETGSDSDASSPRRPRRPRPTGRPRPRPTGASTGYIPAFSRQLRRDRDDSGSNEVEDNGSSGSDEASGRRDHRRRNHPHPTGLPGRTGQRRRNRPRPTGQPRATGRPRPRPTGLPNVTGQPGHRRRNHPRPTGQPRVTGEPRPTGGPRDRDDDDTPRRPRPTGQPRGGRGGRRGNGRRRGNGGRGGNGGRSGGGHGDRGSQRGRRSLYGMIQDFANMF